MAFEYAVALTGGIATGKSTVAQILKEYGFEIIDADKIAHDVLDSQYRKIAELFGQEFVNGKSVDRKHLGSVVFSDPQKRKTLESLVHPLIYQEIEHQAEQMDTLLKPYFVDIPLFFETKRYPIKRSLLVYASKEEQLKRLMRRDGYNTQNALQRIDSQMPIDEKRELATYLIENTGSLEALKTACIEVIKKIKQEELTDDGN